ncbi:hypothetical protein TWF751_004182 [Orbilia oligospora]|nr:hypothetical protein TWF751_004182 [Orbilia oligospora]KAF3235138.1 hypothetical protein TWF128_002130 [Orbilia oligospora]
MTISLNLSNILSPSADLRTPVYSSGPEQNSHRQPSESQSVRSCEINPHAGPLVFLSLVLHAGSSFLLVPVECRNAGQLQDQEAGAQVHIQKSGFHAFSSFYKWGFYV